MNLKYCFIVCALASSSTQADNLHARQLRFFLDDSGLCLFQWDDFFLCENERGAASQFRRGSITHRQCEYFAL